ncbi:radical SAM family heme chaperone HemW [Hirschia baltica]|uniref:Heme chaperone HemW n=1 Tax=Hirschia baltica (strain ATCC 49814 / DSM 5838 / IFAM 1418) TaxID=582402 RepID=C6XIH0_HIRBI|nr:radical SAM family heme chaperone HemW [Hirschia baltica]ACT60777.1 oxygen-independent coproporphyrinogen III oxidase [Hirschia baltica ATCC 49814]
MLQFEPHRGFGIYIHWPYCAKICPYCDFNVYAAKDRNIDPLLLAIREDLKGWREKTGSRHVDTVFLGGGTPSLLPPEAIRQLLADIAELWPLRDDAEITLEANPDDMNRFAGIADAGVNRLSLGVQSLDDAALTFLGRNHSAKIALEAIGEGRRCFSSLSLDFIYALPNQSKEKWQAELSDIIDLGADHLSLYELTIEQRTAFGKAVSRGDWTPANEDVAADLYEVTQLEMEAAGYSAYEISNHAKSVQHQAKHNIVYWKSGDWLGVGPGAHGRVTLDGKRLETISEKRPDKYISKVEKTGVGADYNPLSIEDIAAERVMMGLRMTQGILRSDFEKISGRCFDETAIASFISDGLIELDGSILKLTAEGCLLADYISQKLVLE